MLCAPHNSAIPSFPWAAASQGRCFPAHVFSSHFPLLPCCIQGQEAGGRNVSLALPGLSIRNEYAWSKHLVLCTGGLMTLEGPGATIPSPTAPSLAPPCQSGHKKATRWLSPVCLVHQLALLPFSLVTFFFDFYPCQLVSPH